MPAHCSVPGCTDREVGTRYFRIPKNKKQEWLNALGLQHLSRNGTVCSKHFRPRDLYPAPYYGSNQRGYKYGALPTRYPHLDSSPERSSTVDVSVDTNERILPSESGSINEMNDAPKTDKKVEKNEKVRTRRSKYSRVKDIARIGAIKNHWRLVNYERHGANVLEEYVDNR